MRNVSHDQNDGTGIAKHVQDIGSICKLYCNAILCYTDPMHTYFAQVFKARISCCLIRARSPFSDMMMAAKTLLGAALVVMADAVLMVVRDVYENLDCTGQVVSRFQGRHETLSKCSETSPGSQIYQKYTCSGEGPATVLVASDSSCSNPNRTLTDQVGDCFLGGAAATCVDVDVVTITSYYWPNCTGTLGTDSSQEYSLGCTPTGDSYYQHSMKIEVSDSGLTELSRYFGNSNCTGQNLTQWIPCGGEDVCTRMSSTSYITVIGTAVNCPTGRTVVQAGAAVIYMDLPLLSSLLIPLLF